jgi:hypothetical protein
MKTVIPHALINALIYLIYLLFPLVWPAAFVLALPFNFIEANRDAFGDFRRMFLSRRSWAEWIAGLIHPRREGLFL